MMLPEINMGKRHRYKAGGFPLGVMCVCYLVWYVKVFMYNLKTCNFGIVGVLNNNLVVKHAAK